MNYEFLIGSKKTHLTKNTYDIHAPHDGSVVDTIPNADARDVDAAVSAATSAFEGEWRNMDSDSRADLLYKWADVLESRAEEIGPIAALESGRPTAERIRAVRGSAKHIRYFAGWVGKFDGSVLHSEDRRLNFTVREPVGVVAVMPPWNMAPGGAIQKLAPALAGGNTAVVRGPDQAPISTLMLGDTILEAGFPPGVVNIIASGNPATSQALVTHQGVRLVSFTGSVAVGKAIVRQAAEGMKRVVLELGGKSAFVVFADADLDAAADTVVEAAYHYQGQVCCAASRVVVQREAVEDFRSKIVERVGRYKPAYPDDPTDGPTIGPLFNAQQLARVERYVEVGKQEGALLAGGSRITEGRFGNAAYFEPTIFEFSDDHSAVAREEIFGPVLSFVPFSSEEEAIRIVNSVPYGLSASVWSRDIGTLYSCTRKIDAGTVWANCYNVFSFHSPWGGRKESGMGKEFGRQAIESLTDEKNVWINAT